jgi:hypothetical protein
MCYDFQHGIIDDEKDVVFITKLRLFCTCIILLPKGVRVLPKSWVELDVIPQLVGFMPNTSAIGTLKLVGTQPRISPKGMLYPKTYYHRIIIDNMWMKYMFKRRCSK